ncbi:MAG: hypothetical protein J6A83_07715 [Clostridia bacterium]|nr:hypothetical protein [Clostridia bacterium]
MKHNNLIKAIISLSLAIIMLCSFAIPTFAAEKPEETVEPRWTSIANMHIDMAFDGTQGAVSGTARKQSTADIIAGTLYLYKWNGSHYEYITEASGSKTIGTLGISIDFESEIGVQYKAVFTVIAYTDNIGESETIEYYETCA